MVGPQYGPIREVRHELDWEEEPDWKEKSVALGPVRVRVVEAGKAWRHEIKGICSLGSEGAASEVESCHQRERGVVGARGQPGISSAGNDVYE